MLGRDVVFAYLRDLGVRYMFGVPGTNEDRVAARFADYLTNRSYLNAREGRWIHTSFWHDRVENAA